jgi:hypothetical protein
MTIMANHSSATERKESPHPVQSTNRTISLDLKRRAQSVINNKSIDAGTRAIIHYGLEINDPLLPQLVLRTEAGEIIIDNLNFSQTPPTNDDSSEEKIEALAEMICRAGDEPGTKSAALLVLMATLENAAHPRALANTAKHFAFTRCGELNLYGMVDAQIAVLESELFADNTLMS